MGFAIAGVVAAGASAYESSQASSAAGNAANAQSNMAQGLRDKNLQEAQMAGDRIRSLAQASPMELDQQQRALQAVGTQLESQQRLLNAIDPAIMEASKQALSILKGDQAASLNPMMNQRQTQRNKLVATLRAQLGPGAETSSMGQQQLQLFDQQTDLMMNQAQQGQLGNLTNVMNGFNSARPDLAGTAQSGMNIASAFKNRQLGAEQNSDSMLMGVLSGTSQGLIDTAGSQYAGAQLQARGYQQLANSVSGLAFQQAGKNSVPARNPGGTAGTGGGTSLSGAMNNGTNSGQGAAYFNGPNPYE